MAAELSHLQNLDQMKHKYKKTVKDIYFSNEAEIFLVKFKGLMFISVNFSVMFTDFLSYSFGHLETVMLTLLLFS